MSKYPNPNLNLLSRLIGSYKNNGTDLSGNGNNLNPTGSVLYGEGINGETDGASAVDSTNTYQSPSILIPEDSHLSFSVFIRLDNNQVDAAKIDFNTLFADGFFSIGLQRLSNTPKNILKFSLPVSTGDTTRIVLELDGSSENFIHLVITKDNDSAKVYIDGDLYAEVQSVTWGTGLTQFVISTDAPIETPFFWEYLNIYRGALSQEEVLALFNGGDGFQPV